MKPTAVKNGIKGIFPIINQHCPQAVYHPPNLAALTGSRIAIDATLLLQRLHFTPDPNPNRHLLGFYRLIQQLRNQKIYPIMIFDNPNPNSRLKEKSREQSNRRRQRKILKRRERIEWHRFQRLNRLRDKLQLWNALQHTEKLQVAEILRKWDAGNLLQGQELESEQHFWEDEHDHQVDSHHDHQIQVAELADEFFHQEASSSSSTSATPSASISSMIQDLDHEMNQSYSSFSYPPASPSSRSTSSSSSSFYLNPKFPANPINEAAFPLQEESLQELQETEDLENWSIILENEVSTHFALAMEFQKLKSDFIHSFQMIQSPPSSFTTTDNQHSIPAILDSKSDPQFRKNPVETVEKLSQEKIKIQSMAQDKLTFLEMEIYETLLSFGLKDPSKVFPSFRESLKDSSLIFKEEIGENAGNSLETKSRQVPEFPNEDSTSPDFNPGSTPMPSSPPSTPASTSASSASTPASRAPSAKPDFSTSLTNLTSQSLQLLTSYSKSSLSIPKNVHLSCSKLCSLMKVPVLWTGEGGSSGKIHEAETLASMLVKYDIADVVASEDSDVILHDVPLLRGIIGGNGLTIVDSKRVRRSLFPLDLKQGEGRDSSKVANEKKVTERTEEDQGEERDSNLTIHSETSDSLSPEQRELKAETESKRKMLDFSLLCGTDFNRTIKGVGPKTALKLIQEYPSIPSILRCSSKKYLPPDGLTWREYSKELASARGVFRNTPAVGRIGSRLTWGIEKVSKSRPEMDSDPSKDLIRDGSAGVLNLDQDSDLQSSPSSTTSSTPFSNQANPKETFLERMKRLYSTPNLDFKPNLQIDESSSSPSSIFKFTSETDPSSSISWTYDHSEVSKFMRENQVFSKPFLSHETERGVRVSVDSHRPDFDEQESQSSRLDLDLDLHLRRDPDPDPEIEIEKSHRKKGEKKSKVKGKKEKEIQNNSFGTDLFKDGIGKPIASWNPENH